MTCVNIHLGRNHALIATDSELAAGTARFAVTKVFSIPHLSAAITGRGSFMKVLTLFQTAMISGLNNGDDLAEHIPVLLRELRKQAPTPLFPDMETEIFCVWYSPAAKRMRARRYSGYERGACVVEDIPNGILAPYFAGEMSDTIPSDIDGMRAVMARQVEGMKRHHPDEATGGNMFCTWVREGEIHTRDEGAIPAATLPCSAP